MRSYSYGHRLSPPPCTTIWSAIFLHKWQKTHTVIKVKDEFDSIHFEKTFYRYQDKWVYKFTVVIVEGNLRPWQPQMLYVIILFIFQRYDYKCSTVCHCYFRQSSNQFRPLDWPEVTYFLLACKLVRAVNFKFTTHAAVHITGAPPQPWHPPVDSLACSDLLSTSVLTDLITSGQPNQDTKYQCCP